MTMKEIGNYHYGDEVGQLSGDSSASPNGSIPFQFEFGYKFQNFFHPFVGELSSS